MTLSVELKNHHKLLEISRDLASTLDLQTLLHKIVNMAALLTNAQEASILLYDPKKMELHFEASTNQNGSEILKNITVPPESIAGWTAIHQEPVFVPDVRQDRRFFDKVEKALDFPTKSIIAVPLISREKLIGVLEVINKKESTFTAQDLDLLQTLSAQAAVAIENSRLFEQSDLVADLVHELRTPLTSIRTIAHLLKQTSLPEEKKEKLLDTIELETGRLNDMITSFLDYVRLEAGRARYAFEKFNINELLKECMVMIIPKAHDQNLRVDFNLENEDLFIEADRTKIKQVILNLLTNAVNYNRENGVIWVRLTKKTDSVRIEVADTGQGISAEEKPHIFTKFYRSENFVKDITGTGLGLAICKQLVEGHHGKIWFESELEKGSQFFFEIPFTQPEI